jgi:hypothetical protein
LASLKQSVLSTEYVRVAWATNPPEDPTTDTVYLAFIEGTDEPETGEWVPGGWETVGAKYYARVLVGPDGDKILGVGNYEVWSKVIDNPEHPVRKVGKLVIF